MVLFRHEMKDDTAATWSRQSLAYETRNQINNYDFKTRPSTQNATYNSMGFQSECKDSGDSVKASCPDVLLCSESSSD